MDPASGRNAVHWVCLETRSARGLVILPPLIGAGAAYQLRTFRWLTRWGLDLLSFDYSGHGHSGGRFSLHASLADTYQVMAMGRARAREKGVPLFGVAACYGAGPLAWAAQRLGEPLAKMVFINPIPAFDIHGMWNAFRRWRQGNTGAGHALTGARQAFRGFADHLFPYTPKGAFGFGTLTRRRTRLLATLMEGLRFEPLRHNRPLRTNLLCLYAKTDIVRSAAGYETDREYLRRLRQWFPASRFYSLDDSHYLENPVTRSKIRRLTRAFLTAG